MLATLSSGGSKKEERREAGVGFAKSHIVSKLSGLPKGINDRLMTLRLLLSGKRHATIERAYAPKMTNPDEVKDKFYDGLDSVIFATPRTDKLILLRDLNARVGTDHQTWEGVIGTEGIGKCNSNGLLLLKKCAEHELLITNTVFRRQLAPDGALKPRSVIHLGEGNSKQKPTYLDLPVPAM